MLNIHCKKLIPICENLLYFRFIIQNLFTKDLLVSYSKTTFQNLKILLNEL